MNETVFETIKLFRGRMEVSLPEGFVDMPDYLAKRKYPSRHRPPVLLMSRDTLVNYGFHLTEAPLAGNRLRDAMETFLYQSRRVMPGAHFGGIQYTDRVDGQAAYFSYEVPAADTDIFQITYITDIGGKLLHGMFNCLSQERENWEETALSSIRSIKEVGKA